MTTEERPELRPAYQTLNDPARLLGVSIAGWAGLLAAGGAGYGWLLVSPLPWRLNFTLVVLVLASTGPTIDVLRSSAPLIAPGFKVHQR